MKMPDKAPKMVLVNASFTTNLMRRILFWSLGIHISAVILTVALTLMLRGDIASTIANAIYVLVLITVLQVVISSFTIQWNFFLDTKRTNMPFSSLLWGVFIGHTSHYLLKLSENAAVVAIRPSDFELSLSICCSAVSIFAFLVDLDRNGGPDFTLPALSPKVLHSMRQFVLSNAINWFKTSSFIGISVALSVQLLFSFSVDKTCKLSGFFCDYKIKSGTLSILSICYSIAASLFLRSFLEIAHAFLIVMLTYPMDFSKLNLSGQSSNLISNGENTFLSEALAIGGAKLGGEGYSWQQYRPTAEGGGAKIDSASTKSTETSTSTPRRPFSYIEISGGQARATSSWQEAVNRQKAFVDELQASIKPSLYGPPLVPFLSSRNRDLTRQGVLCRSLAFQDLKRISSSKDKIKSLFKANGKWPEIVFSCCGMIDAVTVQIQLLVSYAVHEIIEPQLAEIVSHAHRTASLVAKSSHQSRPVGLIDSLVTNGYAVASEWNGSTQPAAAAVIKMGKELRQKSLMGRIYSTVTASKVLSAVVPAAISLSMKGVTNVDPDPIPPILAQTAVHAIEASSLLLVSALSTDPTGTAQHHLIAVMHSLLALDLALSSHRDILRSCLPSPKGTVTAAYLISGGSVDGHSNAGGSGGASRYRGTSSDQSRRGIAVSSSLSEVAVAADAAITRLIHAYRDILDACVFPKAYADILKSKK